MPTTHTHNKEMWNGTLLWETLDDWGWVFGKRVDVFRMVGCVGANDGPILRGWVYSKSLNRKL